MPAKDFTASGLVLADLSWPEVRDIRDGVELVLIPIGSNEQHGPNLPLKMDSAAAFEFSRRASMRMAPRLLVAPAVPWGVSLHHMHFPGTITLTPDTFIEVLVEVIDSLHQHGFERFLIVNGHGGNIAAMDIAAVRAKTELDVPFVGACTYVSFFDDDVYTRHKTAPINGHACDMETAVAMELLPEIVRHESLAKGELTELAAGLYQSMRKYGVSIPYYFEEYTRNGALGDATLATPEFGRELIETGLTNFCAFVEELLASPFAGGGRGAGGTR